MAPNDAGGLQVLIALRRNGISAFPARCLEEPAVRLRVPGRVLVLAASLEAMRHILLTAAGDYVRLPAGRRILGPIVGRGLLVSEGAAWCRQRHAMAPAFTPRSVPVLAGHIMRCTEHACTRLEAVPPGTPVNLLAKMQRLSLEIAAASMFSLETAAFGAELRGMVTHYLTTIGRPSPGDFLLPRGIPTLLGLRRQLFRRRWTRLIGTIIRQRRDQARTQSGFSDGGAPRDLFDLMAAAHGEEAENLLADEVATMIVAGHETTALLLFWDCWLLAQVPDWQDAVTEEAAGLDLSPADAAASLPALASTRAVVQETLRLYPPAFNTRYRFAAARWRRGSWRRSAPRSRRDG